MDSTLHLETLLVDYDNTLSDFKQAQTNYFETVKSNALLDASTDIKLTNIPNSQFFGASWLKTTYVANINECSTLCSNSTLCSGATYNNADGNCSMQSGKGTITHHSSNHAIIPKSVKYLFEMDTYITQLKSINVKIIHLTKTTMIPDIFKTNSKISIKSNKLQERDVLLTNRQDELKALIAKISPELDNVYSESQLTLQSLKWWYGFLLILIIGIIVVILKMSAVGTVLTSSLSNAILSTSTTMPGIPNISFIKQS